jgi:hypothetical protein
MQQLIANNTPGGVFFSLVQRDWKWDITVQRVCDGASGSNLQALDVIRRVNGTPVTDLAALEQCLKLGVWRDSCTFEVYRPVVSITRDTEVAVAVAAVVPGPMEVGPDLLPPAGPGVGEGAVLAPEQCPLAFMVERANWKAASGADYVAAAQRQRGDTVLGDVERRLMVRHWLEASGTAFVGGGGAQSLFRQNVAPVGDADTAAPARKQRKGRRGRGGRHRWRQRGPVAGLTVAAERVARMAAVVGVVDGPPIAPTDQHVELRDFIARQIRAADLHRHDCGVWVPAIAVAAALEPAAPTMDAIAEQYRLQLCRVGVELEQRISRATDVVAVEARVCAGRRRHRALDSFLQELNAFASLTVQDTKSPRVLCMGADFGWNGGARACFPFRQIYRLLAKQCLVIQADEFRTSSYCPCCNGKLSHPSTARGTPIKGSLYCASDACSMNHYFFNRDTLAALTIGLKFVFERVVGDYAGAFSRWSAPGDSAGMAAGAVGEAHEARAARVQMSSVDLVGFFLPKDVATTSVMAAAPQFSSTNIARGLVPSSLRALLKQQRAARPHSELQPPGP